MAIVRITTEPAGKFNLKDRYLSKDLNNLAKSRLRYLKFLSFFSILSLILNIFLIYKSNY